MSIFQNKGDVNITVWGKKRTEKQGCHPWEDKDQVSCWFDFPEILVVLCLREICTNPKGGTRRIMHKYVYSYQRVKERMLIGGQPPL